MNKILLILFLLSPIICIAQEYKIAITIDDLPCTNCESAEETRKLIAKLMHTLKTYSAPAIGFVNEYKLYTKDRSDTNKINIIREWLNNGFDIGNHTYSHISINNVSIEEYKADILRGEILTRPLVQEYKKELKYFRHTQLRTGPNLKYKNKLDKILLENGYITAAVTMDNDEYIYSYCYRRAMLDGDSVGMRLIAYDYLNYMKVIFDHFEKESIDFLGYNINHILLLHANELNADYLDFLLKILKNKGYSFVTIDEALKDPAYQLPESHSERGLSWIYRWKIAKGEQYHPQPAISDQMASYYQNYRNSLNKSQNKYQRLMGPETDINAILAKIKKFSHYYELKNYDSLACSYTVDGKIFPKHSAIIEGRDAIKQRWILPADQTVIKHRITPVEIQVIEKTAYGFGYYEGKTAFTDGSISSWYGKYVIVWKKIKGEWKIYLDIWNSI